MKSNVAYLPQHDEPEFDDYDGDDGLYEVEECDHCGNKTFVLRQADIDEDSSFFMRQCANIDCGEIYESIYLEHEMVYDEE